MLRVSESNSENELNVQYPWRNNVRGWDAVQTIRMINTSPVGKLKCIKLYLKLETPRENFMQRWA